MGDCLEMMNFLFCWNFLRILEKFLDFPWETRKLLVFVIKVPGNQGSSRIIIDFLPPPIIPGQTRLCTFFENLGWKVFRSPETATVLLKGGIKFSDLSQKESYKFQENLIRTMIQIENTFFELAETVSETRNCLIICDRGVMDASAYLTPEKWEKMKRDNKWNDIELRDNRYNQVRPCTLTFFMRLFGNFCYHF